MSNRVWAFLLIPARQQVMTTQLYLFFQYPARPNLAAAYGVPLLAVAVGLFWLQQWLVRRGSRRRERSSASCGSRSSRPPPSACV